MVPVKRIVMPSGTLAALKVIKVFYVSFENNYGDFQIGVRVQVRINDVCSPSVTMSPN